jgi:hypothetical protein
MIEVNRHTYMHANPPAAKSDGFSRMRLAIANLVHVLAGTSWSFDQPAGHP